MITGMWSLAMLVVGVTGLTVPLLLPKLAEEGWWRVVVC